MSAKRFNDEEAQQIKAAYLAGESLRKIAKRLNVQPTSVRNTLMRIGVKTRSSNTPKFWTEERLSYVISEYSLGRTQQSIADELGIQQANLSKYLRQAGVYRQPARLRPKGGRRKTPEGYIQILPTIEDLIFCKPNSSGYVLEHRLVMARSIGRQLRHDETVHHIDGDRSNNILNNLQLRQGSHGKGIVMKCNHCGSNDIVTTKLS